MTNIDLKLSLLVLMLIISCTANPKSPTEDSFLEIYGNKVHYQISGEGQEIILAHGGFLNLSMWNPQMEILQKEHKVIRFSDLGHRKSEIKAKPVFGSEIIEQLSKANKHNPAILIGHSWGAMIS